jgi:hypothetical protein
VGAEGGEAVGAQRVARRRGSTPAGARRVIACTPPGSPAPGPLAQTKFVLQKALARGLAPLVVLNKVDRPAATQVRARQRAGPRAPAGAAATPR